MLDGLGNRISSSATLSRHALSVFSESSSGLSMTVALALSRKAAFGSNDPDKERIAVEHALIADFWESSTGTAQRSWSTRPQHFSQLVHGRWRTII